MANAWFRMYAEFATDPKVQMLTEVEQRRFIMALCLRCSNEHVTLHDDEVAFQLRISNEEWLKTKQVLVTKGLLDSENSPTNWDKRQYVSDSSAERVAKHRAKRKQLGMTAIDHIHKEVRKRVFERDECRCVYCGSEEDLTLDHKTPTRRGGDNSEANLQVACRVCNADKRHMTHDEYVNWNGRVTLQKRPQNTDTDTEEEANASVASKLPTCPVQQVIDQYHEALPELPMVRLLSDQRRKAIGNFWRWVLTSTKTDGTPRAQTADQALTWIRAYFDRARENDFLMGRNERAGSHANWRCDLDFLLTEKGKKQVIEKTGVAA